MNNEIILTALMATMIFCMGIIIGITFSDKLYVNQCNKFSYFSSISDGKYSCKRIINENSIYE